ncbi:MAG: class I SAM-dependent methyltransferase [Deltaproteobacteria bacterium]|nr:class I SAM-dependent methyltransferase [Deltaproteobacteria bacterium]
MNSMEYIKCSICGSESKFLFKTKNTHGANRITEDEFSLFKCQDCGLIFVNPRPIKSEIIKYYNFNYYLPENKFKSKIEKVLVNLLLLSKKKLISKFKKSGRILDIGCGKGDFLNIMSSDKWETYGIEPNSSGYDLTNNLNYNNNNIFNSELHDCKFPNNYFDVITMWHVFEHIYEPKKELEEINRILKNNGLLILTVPNAKSLGFRIAKQNWFHLDAPRHLFHYEPNTIAKLFPDALGLHIITIKYLQLDFPLDLYHSLLSDKKKFFRIFFSIPLLILLPILKFIGKIFDAPETFMIVCQKKY